MNAFKENKMASGFVTWAKDQIEDFCSMFRRQVYAPTVGSDIIDECVKVAASHNRKLLRDVGLDFTFLLSNLLQEDPTAPVSNTQLTSVFESAFMATPAPGYHIVPSPYVPYEPETPVPSTSIAMYASNSNDRYELPPASRYDDQLVPPRAGGTAPLSIPSRSPRAPKVDLSQEGEARPVLPPRSERRARPPPRTSMEDESMR